MEALFWVVSFWVDGIGFGQAPKPVLGPHQVERVERKLHGQLLDFTRRHGSDRRIWSPALKQYRDLFVYLPPGFDPCKKYPLAIFLHGAAQDEQFFLQVQIERFDQAMAQGLLPPVIIAAPDGSVTGRVTLTKPATFWANSRAGNFEDFVMIDVWNFMFEHFPIRPERQAHALMGVSMGGCAAVGLGIKHRDRVKNIIAFMPPLNLRYVDCHGKYHAPFDPNCFAFRERVRHCEILGRRRFFFLTFKGVFGPLYGRGSGMIDGMASISPLELMEACDLKPGELDIYVAYGCKDEFNVAAQVESFLFFARQRGIDVTVEVDPNGKHNLATGLRLLPGALQWAAQRVPGASTNGRR